MRRREVDQRHGQLVHGVDLSPKLVDDTEEGQRIGEARGMGQGPRQRHPDPAALERRRWVTKHPQSQCRMHVTAHARVVTAVVKGKRPMLLLVIERHPLLTVSASGYRLSHPERRR